MAARVLMVASGKGGTGKSTVSVFLGAELAALGKKVLLIELDSGLRSVDVIAGVSGETVYDISDILSGRCSPEKAVVRSALYPGLSIVSAPYTGGHVETEALRLLIHKMQPYFEEIIVDTAAGLGAPFQAAAAVADLALVVVTPDKVCLRDGRIVTDELYEKVPCKLIINRVDPWRVTRAGLQDLDECIDTVGAQLIGVVPEQDDIPVCGAVGQPLQAGSLSKKVFQNIAGRLAGGQIPLAVR